MHKFEKNKITFFIFYISWPIEFSAGFVQILETNKPDFNMYVISM